MTVISIKDEGFNLFGDDKFTGAVTGHTADTVEDLETVTGENIGTGDGNIVTFAGLLAHDKLRSGTLSVTDTVETFSDNGAGVLTGSLGGTGTITYSTGAYSVTFNTAPTNGQAITADYDYGNWTTNQYVDHAVKFTSGNHSGNSYNIISNTYDTLTCTIPNADVAGENIGTGDGNIVTFAGNLANTPVNAGSVSSTDGTETFSDDGAGNLTGSLGGTGTITYSTGAYSVTFNTAPTNGQAITADYDYELDFNSSGGLAVADTFKILTQHAAIVLNTTPGGTADLVDQDVSALIAIEDEGFSLYRDPTGGATFTVTALVGDGVEDSTESWTVDEWIGSVIEFTSGALNGQKFFVSSNTDNDIISKGINFNTAGVLVGNTFTITPGFFKTLENSTPGGTADLTGQPIIRTLSIKDEGFCLYLDTLGGQVFTVTALVGGGVEDNTESWSEDEWVGYKIEFTSGALSGNSYVIAHNTSDDIYGQGIHFSDSGVLVGDTFKIVPFFFLLVENSTPGGTADLTGQPIIGTISIKDEGFCLYLDTLGGATFTVTGLPGGGVEDNTENWSENEWVGYKIEFTSGVLSGNSYVIAQNTSDDIYGQGIHFSDSGVGIGDTFKIVPFFFLLVDNPTPGGAADLYDQGIEILVQHLDEGFWFYFVLAEKTWGAPPVFGPYRGRGLGTHPSARYGLFVRGKPARGLDKEK